MGIAQIYFVVDDNENVIYLSNKQIKIIMAKKQSIKSAITQWLK